MKKIDWQHIGNKVSDMRRSRNMTQQELAELTGLSEVYIGYLEQGKRHGPMDTYIVIVNTLGYSMYDLLEEYIAAKSPLNPSDTKFLNIACSREEQELVRTLVRETMTFFRRLHGSANSDIIKRR